MTIPDVSLGDANVREPVITENISRARRKLVGPDSVHLSLYAWNFRLFFLALFIVHEHVRGSACSWTRRVHSVHQAKVLYSHARYMCPVSRSLLGDIGFRFFWFQVSQASGTIIIADLIDVVKCSFCLQHSEREVIIKEGDEVYVFKDTK